jgi:hypothetical protein
MMVRCSRFMNHKMAAESNIIVLEQSVGRLGLERT